MLVLIIGAAVLYALFDFFVDKAASGSDPYMANVIFNGLGALIPLVIFLVLRARQHTAPTTKYSIFMNILAGVLIAAFSVLLVKIFARGGNLAYVLPLIYGAAIILGSLLGYFFLKEQISMLQLAGIILTACGIGLVVISKVHV